MNELSPQKGQDKVLQELREIFAEKFEVAEEAVTMDAKLYDDLDIDSIDAVDLMVALKKRTGKKLNPETFKSIRTVGDVVEAVQGLMNES